MGIQSGGIESREEPLGMTAAPSKVTQVESVIEQASDLHALPVVFYELQRLLNDPQTSAQDIADLLSRDPAISGRILKVANSAYYGLQKRIDNLAQAIVVLGFQAIRNLTITLGVIDSFRVEDRGHFDNSRFWAHSVATAIGAETLGRLAKAEQPDSLYMTGLFHDVGKLIAAQHLPALSVVVKKKVERGAPQLEAERETYGFDHAALGALFLARWNLPESILEGVRYHHSSDNEATGPARNSEVVQLANLVVSLLGLASVEEKIPEVGSQLSRRLSYDEDKLAGWIETVGKKLEQADDFFELLGFGSYAFGKQDSTGAGEYES